MSLPFVQSPGRRTLLAAAAVLTVFALFAGTEIAVRIRLQHHIEAFSDRMSPAKLSGNVLQTRAFQTPGLLPIFGSSELNRPAANRPDEFFARRPTGFAAFPIGRGGNSCLILTQKIAAIGSAVSGRKVAIVLSPSWFIKTEVTMGAVKGNLAPLQLGSWIFADRLSAPLKQRIARRLLDYPEALERQPLLSMALGCLKEDSPSSRARLATMWPMGTIQNVLLERLDYCALLREMLVFQNRRALRREKEDHPLGPGAGEPIHWDLLAERAESKDKERGNGNRFSVGAPTLEVGQKAPKPHGKKKANPKSPAIDDDGEDEPTPPPKQKAARNRDAEFMVELAQAKEWTDLGLLLSTLKELHADAIFISQPFNGVYRDMNGNSAGARRAYYDKLHAAIDPSGYPLFDFSEHEEDKYFFNDTGHPSGKAWIYYDHALSDFYGRKS